LPVEFKRPGAATENQPWEDAFIASAPAIAQYCIAQYQAWRAANPIGGIPQAAEALEEVRESSTEALAQSYLNRLLEYGTSSEYYVKSSTLRDAFKRHSKGDYTLEQQMYTCLKVAGYQSKQIERKGERFSAFVGFRLNSTIIMDE